MNYPPRLAHLVTRKVMVARFWPTYAETHFVEEQEAMDRLERGLGGGLWEQVLAETWVALQSRARKLDEAKLLEKVAKTLAERPYRAGKVATVGPAWSAFMLHVDLEAGIAGDTVRRVLETPEGRAKGKEGIAEVGRFLAAELVK